jgi:Vacuolar (H+)-ATPase G subunit.
VLVVLSIFIKFLEKLSFQAKSPLKMASQTQGIQQLLAAEKRAAEKVAEAKKSKFSQPPLAFHFSNHLPL